MIPAALAGGDVTMIAGLVNKMIFSFHAQKEIKSAAQLRGKIIGTDRVGTAQDYGTRVSLSRWALSRRAVFNYCASATRRYYGSRSSQVRFTERR